ncbi:MAG: transposase [Verrucomicrobiae bacterium]|nr:transposase [Verrucomicrobiae bacterium]
MPVSQWVLMSSFLPFDPKDHLTTSRTRRNLPHWEQSGCTQFVTFRLGDSIPASKLADWHAERDEWMEGHEEPWSPEEWREYQERFLDRIERWSDRGYGACWLRNPSLRKILTDALAHFDQDRYELDTFVVMPNHVHMLVKPNHPWRLGQLLHSWKSFSANQINRIQGRKGTLWMDERFDHLVRSVEQLERFRKYIAENPMAAGLEPCEYSLWSRGES